MSDFGSGEFETEKLRGQLEEVRLQFAQLSERIEEQKTIEQRRSSQIALYIELDEEFAEMELPCNYPASTRNNQGRLLLTGLMPGQGLEPGEPGSGQVNLHTIQFDASSFLLSEHARAHLDELYKALKDPILLNFDFVVEAYADQAGSESLEIMVSEVMAKQVVQYLVPQDKEAEDVRTRLHWAACGADYVNDRRIIIRTLP